MGAPVDDVHERNRNSFEGSTIIGSPVVAGSHASVSVASGASVEDPDVASALAELRAALEETRRAAGQRDDETHEALAMAELRLIRLEEELSAPRSRSDWGRVTKLMTGVRESITGLTALTASADALWNAVQHAFH